MANVESANLQVSSNWQAALPFWLSLALVPLIWIAAISGGFWVILPFLVTWYLFSIIDAFAGLNEANPNPDTPDDQLYWYRLITIIWPPIQFITLFGVLWYATRALHLGGWELVFLFLGVGVVTGTVGINYSHELMHQKPKLERWSADILLAMVLYSHFRSEHLLVHHRYVGTPKDPVTAKFNEGLYRFFIRVLKESFLSAWDADKAMRDRKGAGFWDPSNPYVRYIGLQAAFLILALLIGGWVGLCLFVWQAFVAVFHLETVNYIEHYGLVRKHLGDGKYEHVQPHHSWNASHKATNWLLINLQRHSDHHYKPNRRFPLLQTYNGNEAPQLPFGYTTMGILAITPTLWRRVMNPRVRKWRAMYYPEILDWMPYNKKTNPMPR